MNRFDTIFINHITQHGDPARRLPIAVLAAQFPVEFDECIQFVAAQSPFAAPLVPAEQHSADAVTRAMKCARGHRQRAAVEALLSPAGLSGYGTIENIVCALLWTGRSSYDGCWASATHLVARLDAAGFGFGSCAYPLRYPGGVVVESSRFARLVSDVTTAALVRDGMDYQDARIAAQLLEAV